MGWELCAPSTESLAECLFVLWALIASKLPTGSPFQCHGYQSDMVAERLPHCRVYGDRVANRDEICTVKCAEVTTFRTFSVRIHHGLRHRVAPLDHHIAERQVVEGRHSPKEIVTQQVVCVQADERRQLAAAC
eukprot:CAMPEP_0174696588 /NCGR_PEP_ID=MMETSP1094-20130205/2703_1 /TAXON_ID=156173 /ORGANISM="Chrysochromulina brevifilum, Strain UTEX LB 985" /LENGTH=132 /DNA_ID=CAMNT_0015893397 /DNA_START=591 /DNA_END=990 /DNA_ORIENTATION=+